MLQTFKKCNLLAKLLAIVLLIATFSGCGSIDNWSNNWNGYGYRTNDIGSYQKDPLPPKSEAGLVSDLYYNTYNNQISWRKARLATSYRVNINGTDYTTTDNKIPLPGGYAVGTEIDIKVYSIDKDGVETQEFISEIATVIAKDETNPRYFKDFLLTQTKYSHNFKGELVQFAKMDETKMICSFTEEGDFRIYKVYLSEYKDGWGDVQFLTEIANDKVQVECTGNVNKVHQIILNRQDVYRLGINKYHKEGYEVDILYSTNTMMNQDSTFYMIGLAKLTKGDDVKYASYVYEIEYENAQSASQTYFTTIGLRDEENCIIRNRSFIIIKDEDLETVINTWKNNPYAYGTWAEADRQEAEK